MGPPTGPWSGVVSPLGARAMTCARRAVVASGAISGLDVAAEQHVLPDGQEPESFIKTKSSAGIGRIYPEVRLFDARSPKATQRLRDQRRRYAALPVRASNPDSLELGDAQAGVRVSFRVP